MEKETQKSFEYHIHIKIAMFLGVALLIFVLLTTTLVPDYNWPNNYENMTATIKELRKTSDRFDAIFLGTSHAMYAVSPIRMFQDTGIVTYNMGTSGQPVEVSWYLARESFKHHSPKVMILDVSSLFYPENYDVDSLYRYVIDSVPFSFSEEKLDLIRCYCRFRKKLKKDLTMQDSIRTLFGCLFPLYNYHLRWNGLTEADFAKSGINYYTQGYIFSSNIISFETDVAGMNDEAAIMGQDNRAVNIVYDDGIKEVSGKNKALFPETVTDEKLDYVRKINDLCKKHNCKLLLTKIPVVRLPRTYSSAWSVGKYKEMKKISSELQIDYIDLVYEKKVAIDWNRDTMDRGGHLNYLGAKKVSDFFSQYLKSHYGLESQNIESYKKKSSPYMKTARVAELELMDDFSAYIKTLAIHKDRYAIMISVKDDMTSSLTKEDVLALKILGLKTDFSRMKRRLSYIAVIDKDKVLHEEISNRKLLKDISLDQNMAVHLESGGFYSGNTSVISLNGQPESPDGRGINIVVYDYESQQIVDRVCFDTCAPEHTAVHINPNELLQQYIWFVMNHN